MNLISAALSFFACIHAGFITVREYKGRLAELERLTNNILLIKNRISGINETLPELFESLVYEQGDENRLFTVLSSGMEQLGLKSFAAIWAEALDETFPRLKREDISEAVKLGAYLGKSDADSQREILSRCCLRLEERLWAERERSSEKSRLAITLSVCGGAFCLILLI